MKLTVLADEQLNRLHDASIRILERTGVDLPHPEVRRQFHEAGATVDGGSQRVRIPEALVERSLAQATKSFTIYGRDTTKQAVFGMGRRNYNFIAGEALWIDDDTGERRYATVRDAGTAAKLVDVLPNMTIAGAMSDPHELSPQYGGAAAMVEMLRNTTKPLALWFPKLMDRQFYDAWMDGGANTMRQRCREEKERLLEAHQSEPLREDVDKELEMILSGARKRLGEEGRDWRGS